MMRVISLGAGVQSTTMALMAAHGELTPMPDCAIFADTQAEPQSVYDHLAWLMSGNLLPFPVHIVTRGDLAETGLGLHRSKKSGKVYQKNLIPLFIKNPDGSQGILGRKCTSEYKVRQIIGKERELLGGMATIRAWRKNGTSPLIEQWIGISSDEAIRIKPAPEPWIVNKWPLVEGGISRQGCLDWMARNGYPRPPRSACYFCPYHNDNEWRRLRDEEPAEFQRAIEWERRAHEANGKDEATKGKPYLHRSLKPLDEVDLSTLEDHGQLNLFNNECEGMCGV